MTHGIFSIVRAIWFTRHGDIRIAWRLVMFLLAAAVIWGAVAAGLGIAGISSQELEGPGMLVALLSATALMTRLVNRKPFRAAGLGRTRGAFRDLALGCLLGLLMMGGIFVIELALGFVHLESRSLGPMDWLRIVSSSALMFLIAAVAEEILFRGYLFQSLMQGVTFLPAAIGISLLFALAHLGNPGPTVFAIVNIGLAGLWLSFAYLKTRTLWLPVGLHFSWNFCQTVLFSFPTSGIRMEDRTLFSLNQGGPVWITGGGFGPEGGALATIAIVFCTWHILKSSLYRREEGVITLDSIEDLVPGSGRREGSA